MTHLFLCSDKNNLVGLAVTVRSALEASSAPISVHVLHHGIDRAAQRKLVASWDHPRCRQTNFVALDFAEVADFRPTMYLKSRMAYARIYIAKALPEDVGRAVYLDTDLLVYGDISALAAVDLAGKTAGAAIDISLRVADAHPAARRLERRLGLLDGLRYFNSGVVVIDMKRWRDKDLQTQCAKLGIQLADKLDAQDQDLLNVILEDDWHDIGVHWNRSQYEAPVGTRDGIVHLIGKVKPWHPDYAYHFRDAFFDLVDRTAFKGFRPLGSGSSVMSAVARLRRSIPTPAIVASKLGRTARRLARVMQRAPVSRTDTL